MQRRRRLATLGAGLAAALIAIGASPALAERARGATKPAHDLTGVWTNAWYTKLQRPKALKGLVVTPAEAEAYEAPRRRHAGELIEKEDEVGQAETEFPDNGPGLARIHGEIRSSWITDPPDGRIPWTVAARKQLGIGTDRDKLPGVFDDVERRETDERCLTTPGAAAPIINSHDANLLQIVQTPAWLAIVGEKNHQLRIVRLVGARTIDAPSPASPPADWMGASEGHWEGATLVVETKGLRPGVTKISDELWLSDRAQVVERFTRSGPAELTYSFEVSDPTLFTRPWRAEMVFRPAEGQLFEYACHEGNYSLPSILAAARAAEREKAGR
jgi:hypothetical protein